MTSLFKTHKDFRGGGVHWSLWSGLSWCWWQALHLPKRQTPPVGVEKLELAPSRGCMV